jgi:hypothetical protein
MLKLLSFETAKKAWWLFLFPLSFVFHGNNENFGLIPFSISLALFFKYTLLCFSFFLLSLLVFRTAQKAILFTVFLSLLFFYFGNLHDFLKTTFPLSSISSYRVLLPLLFILTTGVFFVLFFYKSGFNTLIRYFKNLYFLLLLLEFLSLGRHLIMPEATFLHKSSIGLIKQCDTARKPDIFFIVFDEYASSKSLKQDLGFDNSGLEDSLKAGNFFVSTQSRSNYNVTPFSLASTFMMDYLQADLKNTAVTSKLFLQAMETFKHNHLTLFFKSQGYDLKNYGGFELANTTLQTKLYFPNAHKKQIDDQTLSSRIIRDIGWKFNRLGQIELIEQENPKGYHLYRNSYNWEKLVEELSSADNKVPRFVYVHLMLPHEPFYLNADGSLAPDSSVLYPLNPRPPYIQQVRYANKLIMKLIGLANKKGKRERVVIIEGDHGYKFFSEAEQPIKTFDNLNAYYFSDGVNHSLYDGISPVNTFRVILNKYFCQSFSLLRDSSVYLYSP